MTKRALRILVDEDARLRRDAPNEWFNQYRAMDLAQLIEDAAQVEQVLRQALARAER